MKKSILSTSLFYQNFILCFIIAIFTLTASYGQDDPFVVQASTITSPTTAEANDGPPDGSFAISITDGASCTGTTYDISATPVVGSTPLGNTPPAPIPNFVINATDAGSPYVFINAGAGQYDIQVTETGPCGQLNTTESIMVTIPGQAYDDPFVVQATLIVSPSISESNSGYVPDGSFSILLTDGASCQGTTYDISATPVVSSSPLGNTPAVPVPGFIINATDAGNPYVFTNAGAGQYDIQVTETGPCGQLNGIESIIVTVPNIVMIPTMSQWGIIILGLILITLGVIFIHQKIYRLRFHF